MARQPGTPLFTVGQVVQTPEGWTGTVTSVKWSAKPRAWWYEVVRAGVAYVTYVVHESALRGV